MTVSWQTKVKILAVYAVAYVAFYVFPNFYNGFNPQQLPLLSIDRAIPFVPWTFAIYVSDYFMALVAIIIINDRGQYFSYARMAFLVLLFCGLFFMAFPTTYPRPVYPVVDNPILSAMMALVGNYDTPNNCFPSHHVAITGTIVFCLRHRPKWEVALYSLWAVAIFVSTLTTKQHYFVDILGGLGVMALVAFLELRVLNPSHAPLPPNPATR